MPTSRDPKSISGLLWSLLAIAVILPLAFHFQFGFIDGYAIGFTTFLILLVAALDLVPRTANAIGAEAIAAEVATVRRSRFDILGVVWLLAIPFAPFLGWLFTNAIELMPANWRMFAAGRAILCVLVPLVCVLPLARYVRPSARRVQIVILVVGTAFPVITGLGAAQDALLGALWQDVEIHALRSIHYRSRAGTGVFVEDAFADLADGRTLRRAGPVHWSVGPNRLLVLRGLGYAIARR